MKANITLKIENDLLKQAKILAAEEGKSVSSLLSATLEDMVRRRREYQRARQRALARLKNASRLGWTAPKSRDELHER